MREIYLATIDSRAWELAEKYDLGIELDQFCTAMYMDGPEFPAYDREVKSMLSRARIFHGPFNELSPCAIDPKIRDISMERYNQAYALMRSYGLNRMILHGGFVPNVYFPIWYVEQSIPFWKEFLSDKPDDFTLYLENVMEPEPSLLLDIAAGVDDPRCRLCYDTGHSNIKTISTVPAEDWIREMAPFLEHLHLHNNNSVWDYHRPLGEGTIDMKETIALLDELVPNASFTFENIQDSEDSILWYLEQFPQR